MSGTTDRSPSGRGCSHGGKGGAVCVWGGMCVCVGVCVGKGKGGDVVQIKDSALTWYALALLGKKERDKKGEKYG